MDDNPSFGAWLRRRRRALDLTQQALADRVGCAVATIKKIEADERRPSHELAGRLADGLAVPADARAGFLRTARLPRASAELLDLTAVSPRPGHNLPAPPNAFVGRAGALAAIADLLAQPALRMLTLTGPGGSGKTRLALQVASGLIGRYVDGVWLVELAALSDSSLVAGAIAQSLGVPAIGSEPLSARLRAALRQRELLLILDNCEHLTAAAPLLAELLAAAPGLVVLATSRVALDLSAEQIYAVPPLELPAPGETAASEAIELFVTRAQAIRPGFRLTPEDAQAVAMICRQLDGLPLAIELAAARTRLFAPAALLKRLSLDMLAEGPRDQPARQRSIRDALAWSERLLTPAEQALFARLGAFAGGWSLDAAEAVAGTGQDTLALLEGLAEQCMVQVRPAEDGEPRFIMLETIRAYALERLAEQGEGEVIQRRHAAYFAQLVAAQADALRGVQQRTAQAQIAAELPNIRAAWRWAVAHEALDLLAAMGWALWQFYTRSGRAHEGTQRFAEAATALAADDPDESLERLRLRVSLWTWEADLWQSIGAMDNARRAIDAALTQLDRPPLAGRLIPERAYALLVFGHLLLFGDIEARLQQLEQSLQLFTELGDMWGTAVAQQLLGHTLTLLLRYDEAEAQYAACLTGLSAFGDAHSIAETQRLMHLLHLHCGRFVESQQLLDETLAYFRAVDDPAMIATTVASWGRNLNSWGRFAEARDVLEQAEAYCIAIDYQPLLAEAQMLLGEANISLGAYVRARAYAEGVLEQARTRGKRLTMAQALYQLGKLLLVAGRIAEADHTMEESLAICRARAYRSMENWVLPRASLTARAAGDIPRAQRHLLAQLHYASEYGIVATLPVGLAAAAALLADAGQHEAARRWWVRANCYEVVVNSRWLQEVLAEVPALHSVELPQALDREPPTLRQAARELLAELNMLGWGASARAV